LKVVRFESWRDPGGWYERLLRRMFSGGVRDHQDASLRILDAQRAPSALTRRLAAEKVRGELFSRRRTGSDNVATCEQGGILVLAVILSPSITRDVIAMTLENSPCKGGKSPFTPHRDSDERARM
jgi:hypothetical protein